MAESIEQRNELAGPYVEALAELAQDEGVLEDTLDQMRQLAGVFDEHPQFEELLGSVLIEPPQRRDTLERVFKPHVSDLVWRFIQVLERRGRSELLGSASRQFVRFAQARLGWIEAHVTSATELDEQIRSELAGVISSTPDKVVIHNQVDSSVLGGVRVRIGDHVFDATLRTQLSQLTRRLVQRGHHEIQSGRDFVSH